MELWALTAVELAAGFRARRFSPVEALESVLTRVAQRDGAINAFATLAADKARTAAFMAGERLARGEAHPLCGIPITVKDLIFTRGLRTVAGSWLLDDFVPDIDAAAVERLRAGHAVIVGKTTTCEFGHKLTGDSLRFGITRNPHDTNRTSGGSSGGAAAGLAAGFGPLALATDAVGSIRVPGAFCGVVGIKPTYGLVPRAPGFPPSWESLAHTGPMARSVADVALMLDAIVGPDGRDRATTPLPATFVRPTAYATVDLARVRLAYAPTLDGAPVDAGVAAAVDDAVETMRMQGFAVADAAPDLRGSHDAIRTIGLSEFAASRADDTPADRARLDPSLVRIVDAIPATSAIDYVRATTFRGALWRAMQAFFADHDVLVLPTVAIPAFAAGALGVTHVAGVAVDEHLGWSPFTYPFNLTGLPALTIPTRLTADGVPVGLQLVGRRYEEATLLAVAAAYERAVGPRSLIASI
jgi:aspartyl-tRNA(Asn)/glutamyl-tRNA(Gln) amidotransferase subunit A